MLQGTEANPQIICGACRTTNGRDDQFCSGCGHGLWEKCGGCGSMVALAVKFCNQCGNNLKEALEAKLEGARHAIERANTVGKEGGYTESIRLLQPLAENPDYRFKELAQTATELIDNHLSEAAFWEKRVSEIESETDSLSNHQKFTEAIDLVHSVPERLRTEKLKQTLAACSASASSYADARDALKKEKKNS